MIGQEAGAGDTGAVFEPGSAQESEGGEYLPRDSHAGRPTHVPTEEMRRQVELHAAALMPQDEIADLLGISRNTMDKYYRVDWQRGRAKAVRRVARKFSALIERGSEKTMLHLSKVLLGLREPKEHNVKVSGPDGGPLQSEHYFSVPREQRLAEIEAMFNRIRASERRVIDAAADGFEDVVRS